MTHKLPGTAPKDCTGASRADRGIKPHPSPGRRSTSWIRAGVRDVGSSPAAPSSAARAGGQSVCCSITPPPQPAAHKEADLGENCDRNSSWQRLWRSPVSSGRGFKSHSSRARRPERTLRKRRDFAGYRSWAPCSAARQRRRAVRWAENWGCEQLLGAGKKDRLCRKFLLWLSVNYDVTYPTHVEHLTEHLKARLSEPCNRGGLCNTHRSFLILDEVSGIAAQDVVSNTPLYDLPGVAQPGKARYFRQAPCMTVTLLQAVERLVMDALITPFLRIYN